MPGWRLDRFPVLSSRAPRALGLGALVLLPQVLLYGAALAGHRILLPLDLLQDGGVYLPRAQGAPPQARQDPVRLDLVTQMEISRRFAAAEVRSGRLPLWNPLNYCGAPFLAANQTGVFSPFRLLDYAWPDPASLAWNQLLQAMVAAGGAFLFFRRSLRLCFIASAVGAAAFPLTGFLTLWAGHPPGAAATWLPWLFWAVDRIVRRPSGLGGPALALATAAALLSGHAGVAAHMLLGSGLYAAWRLALGGRRGLPAGRRLASAAVVAGGWLLGALLSAIQTLPTLDYMGRSQRLAARAGGGVETPPVGWSALPQVVLPHFYGSTEPGSLYLAPGNRQESAAAAYAGLTFSLVLAPLGFARRRHRRGQAFWLLLAAFGLGQILGLPLLSHLYSRWPLDTLRNNRLALLTAFAVLAAGVTGLDALFQRRRRWSARWVAVAVLPIALGSLCAYRAFVPPAGLRTELERAAAWLASGRPLNPPYYDAEGLARIRSWFVRHYAAAGLACAAAASLALALGSRAATRPAFASIAGLLAAAEMTLAARGAHPQSDPALYYPRIPVLAALAGSSPGRLCGVRCLPASLNQVYRLADIRGYDAADPLPILSVLELVRDRSGPPAAEYAAVQWLSPLDSPVADMLNLRYLVYRGAPPAGVRPMLAGGDYWVQERPLALPRVFVPVRTEVVADAREVLHRLVRPDFDAREVAYVQHAWQPMDAPVRGQAAIRAEVPSRILIDAEMESPGLVVLADQWDPGWKASVNGRPASVLRANHALRGVAVPAGRSEVDFRYEPESFRQGARLTGAAMAALLVWAARVRFRRRTA